MYLSIVPLDKTIRKKENSINYAHIITYMLMFTFLRSVILPREA